MTTERGPRGNAPGNVESVLSALKRSGFPLQARVEHEIQKRVPGSWQLLASEHPWRDREGEDQFIDLVASCGSVVLVIECKKAQERCLLFLRPLGGTTTGIVKTVTAWHVEQNQGAGKAFGIVLREDLEVIPESFQSQFCVSTDTGQKPGQRLLEKDVRPIVLAADAVVQLIPGLDLPARSCVFRPS